MDKDLFKNTMKSNKDNSDNKAKTKQPAEDKAEKKKVTFQPSVKDSSKKSPKSGTSDDGMYVSIFCVNLKNYYLCWKIA